ncbi:MAG TPA: carboxypeptidase regulatory-like domain-containing protein [Candidatus Acidoferrales bacterium]|nr:carboxypeptidase regulatory-like domain-containing protein [Candidatus Acidoferrales bacterium]
MRVLLGLFAICGFASSSHAQVTGSITGTVRDTGGGAVREAKITVVSKESGATRTVATDDLGNYLVVSLPLGLQELKAEKQGFKSVVRTGVSLGVGQEAVVNFRLEVGDLVQEMSVSEEAPVINTTTASVSGMVDERQIKDLPLNGRSFDDLITLNPATINYALKSPNTSTSNGNTFSVAGRRTSENLFLLNGVEYMGSSQLAVTPGGTSGYLLGVDGIREFNVLTDTYSAEYGKRAGAQVSVITQSGTNQFHGAAFEFVRNSAFDSPGPFDQGTVPPFRRNQFGGALGGPLKKDRIFLFGNYEGFRQSLDLSSVSVVPDALARTGKLPDACTGVYATVPKLNSFMLGYMAFWPTSNGPELTVPAAAKTSGGAACSNKAAVASGTAKAFYNPNEHIQEDFGTLRADFNLTKADTLSGAYTIDDGSSLIPLSDPLFASFTPLRMQVGSVSETHIFSPSVLNTAMFGFSRASFALGSVPLVTIPSSLSFVSGMGPGGIVIGGGATTTANGSITSAGANNAAGSVNHRNLFTYQDDLRITRGIHQLGAGIWFQRLQDNEDTASRQLGQATFASLTTFLQGTVTNFQVVPMHTELGWRNLMGAWYVDDTIRVRRNLTIEAGLRQEFTTGWNEAYGRASNYVENRSGVLVTAPIVGNSVYTQNNAVRLFSPRVSMAWDVFGNGKTAVRAGYGMYYSLIDDLAFLQNSLPPFNGAATFTGTIFPTVSPAPANPNNIFPIIPGPPPANTIYSPQGIQANAKTPAVQEWNLSIEQQLSTNTSFRVAYVGSFGVHGLLSVDPNTIAAQTCAAATCTSGGIATLASFGGVAPTVPNGATYIPGPGAKRPNPALSSAFFWLTEGNSRYNALEADVTHRVSRGLQFRGNYTWAKNLDINSGLTGAQANNQAQMVLNRSNLREDWGRSALTPASQASISANYDLPFGHNQRWMNDVSRVRSKFVSGWQVNGIGTFLSGFPFTPLIGSNRSGDGDTRNPDRPSIAAGFTGPIVTGNPNQWFNPAAFVLPTAGTFGNLGRGTLKGPGLADVDFSLFKNTAITEKTNLQFRAEFFNIFNRSNYGAPNTTVFSSGAVSPSAGLITTAATFPRQIQLGLKLLF